MTWKLACSRSKKRGNSSNDSGAMRGGGGRTGGRLNCFNLFRLVELPLHFNFFSLRSNLKNIGRDGASRKKQISNYILSMRPYPDRS
eukprot:1144949-Pelagomonas_calceolata.AAC.5